MHTRVKATHTAILCNYVMFFLQLSTAVMRPAQSSVTSYFTVNATFVSQTVLGSELTQWNI